MYIKSSVSCRPARPHGHNSARVAALWAVVPVRSGEGVRAGVKSSFFYGRLQSTISGIKGAVFGIKGAKCGAYASSRPEKSSISTAMRHEGEMRRAPISRISNRRAPLQVHKRQAAPWPALPARRGRQSICGRRIVSKAAKRRARALPAAAAPAYSFVKIRRRRGCASTRRRASGGIAKNSRPGDGGASKAMVTAYWHLAAF